MTPIRSVLWLTADTGAASESMPSDSPRPFQAAAFTIPLPQRASVLMTVSRTDAHFGFSHRPFRGTPDPEDYVELDSIEQEIDRLEAAIRQGDGVSVITAPPGAGKTVVCERLRGVLSQQFSPAVLSSSGFASRRSLLQAILFALGQTYENLSEQELRLRILNFARQIATTKESIVLIVDEAHLLNARLLEELRCLTNHTERGRSLIRVVLCGQLALEDALVRPELQSLNYRITCHATLEPLSLQESAELVAGRLLHAGRTFDAIFSVEALETICRVSDGNPRCLVQLSDRALDITAAKEEPLVSADSVRRALQDLKQLPLQWNESAIDEMPAEEAVISDEGLFSDEPDAHEEAPSHCDSSRAVTDPESDTTPGEWSQAVATVEVGSEAGPPMPPDAGAEIQATEPHESAATMESDRRSPEEDGVEWDEEELVDDFAAADPSVDELSPYDELEESAQHSVDEDDVWDDDISEFAPSTAAQHEEHVIAEQKDADDFVELKVDDVYASLDDSGLTPLGLTTVGDLVSALASPVTSSEQTDEKSIPQFPAAADPEERMLQADLDPQERVEEIMSTLDSLTDSEEASEPAEPQQTSAEPQESGVTVDWKNSGEDLSFDVVEPGGVPDPEEPENDVPEVAETGTALPPEEPESASTERRSVSPAHREIRPYARLFSQLRKCRS